MYEDEKALRLAQELSSHEWYVLNSTHLLLNLLNVGITLHGQELMRKGLLKQRKETIYRTHLGDKVLAWRDIFDDPTAPWIVPK